MFPLKLTVYKTGVLSHESLPPPLPPVVVPAFKEGPEEFYVSSNQEPGSVHIFVTVETPYSLFFLYGVATSRLKQKGYKAEHLEGLHLLFSSYPPTPHSSKDSSHQSKTKENSGRHSVCVYARVLGNHEREGHLSTTQNRGVYHAREAFHSNGS